MSRFFQAPPLRLRQQLQYWILITCSRSFEQLLGGRRAGQKSRGPCSQVATGLGQVPCLTSAGICNTTGYSQHDQLSFFPFHTRQMLLAAAGRPEEISKHSQDLPSMSVAAREYCCGNQSTVDVFKNPRSPPNRRPTSASASRHLAEHEAGW